MDIDPRAIKAVTELGLDTSYLADEKYTLAEWDKLKELKAGFPSNYEGMQLTNGVETVNLVSQNSKANTASVDDNDYFDGVMKLKAAHPELPVYEIHNHPSVEGYIRAGVFFDDGDDGWKQRQRLASSVPSAADSRRWNALYSLVGAGIYVQDMDEVRVFREGDERNKVGTKLAIEYDENRTPLSAYWAPEEENNPMTAYIRPEEWQERKGEWMPYFNRTTFAAPWVK